MDEIPCNLKSNNNKNNNKREKIIIQISDELMFMVGFMGLNEGGPTYGLNGDEKSYLSMWHGCGHAIWTISNQHTYIFLFLTPNMYILINIIIIIVICS